MHERGRILFLTACVLAIAPAAVAPGQNLRVAAPQQDAIVLTAAVKVSGSSNAANGTSVRIAGGAGAAVTAPVQNGRWEAATVPLKNGVNVLTVTVAGAT